MKLFNLQGQAVYFNNVTKHGRERWQIQAASGQTLPGRDRQRLKSRTFAQIAQAKRYLEKQGYDISEPEFY